MASHLSILNKKNSPFHIWRYLSPNTPIFISPSGRMKFSANDSFVFPFHLFTFSNLDTRNRTMKKYVDPIGQQTKARWEEVFQKATAAFKATQKTKLDEQKKEPVKLRVKLLEMPHECERVLLVPQDISMRQLHFFIQWSMGWKNCHLFDFRDDINQPSLSVGMIIEELDDFDPPTQDAHYVMLENPFMEDFKKRSFFYLYDFGDHWMHEINFLKPTQSDIESFTGYPLCLQATGKCPPEDVGGMRGYEEFLEVVNDPKHEDYKRYRRWAGIDQKSLYDPFHVDRALINYRLTHYFLSRKYHKDIYEVSGPYTR